MRVSAEARRGAPREGHAGRRHRGRLVRAILLGLLLLPAACGTRVDKLPPISTTPLKDYRLGPGDQLRIITFGEEQLTGEFRVSATGDIALPLVGIVHAGGLTSRELATATANALRASNLYRKPSVTVEVVSYRPFFVLGEVTRPGQYPYQPGITVITAVAVAGGFTYRAVDDVFSVVRTTGETTTEGKADRQTPLQPGDVVTVFERRF